MTWAQRLKHVCNIDMPQGTLSRRFASIHLVEVCARCGGPARVMPKALASCAGQALACIEDQDVMPDKAGQALDRILDHLRQKEQEKPARPLGENNARAGTCMFCSWQTKQTSR